MKRLLQWLRRDRVLEAFLAKAARWQRTAAEWDKWQALERRDPATLNFTDTLDLKMYRMQADMRRELQRQLFGDKPMSKLEGLNAVMKAEYAPRMWREMQRPNTLLQQLRDADE